MTDELDDGEKMVLMAFVTILLAVFAVIVYHVLDWLHSVRQFIWTQVEPGVSYLVAVDEIAITIPATVDVGFGILLGFILTLLILHAHSSVRQAISEVSDR